MGDPVVHFEIHAPDNVALGTFYSDLFGWHVQSFPMGEGAPYVTIDTHGGGGINGGISHDEDRRVMFYVEVADPTAKLKKIEAAGGSTIVPETEIPNVVTFAMFADPLGNVTGLVKGGDEGPGVSAGSNPPVAWFEIMSAEPQKLATFYADIFGWSAKKSEFSGEITYFEIETAGGDRGINGGIGGSPDGSNMTTVYASVADIKTALAKAESLGGKTVMGPMDVGGQLQVAAILDPSGNVFGLFEGNA